MDDVPGVQEMEVDVAVNVNAEEVAPPVDKDKFEEKCSALRVSVHNILSSVMFLNYNSLTSFSANGELDRNGGAGSGS